MIYRHRGGLYVNLTNRCPTSCVFCIKRRWKMCFEGVDLSLEREPEADEILAAVDKAGGGSEIVFCGFGEPTYRLDVIKEVCRGARRMRAEPNRAARRRGGDPSGGGRGKRPRLRLNTVGLGNLIQRRDIVPELARTLDAVSVSLNTADPEQWLRLHRPASRFRREGFESVLEFVRGCVFDGLETVVTAVENPAVDIAAVRALARRLGADFRSRPLLRESSYDPQAH